MIVFAVRPFACILILICTYYRRFITENLLTIIMGLPLRLIQNHLVSSFQLASVKDHAVRIRHLGLHFLVLTANYVCLRPFVHGVILGVQVHCFLARLLEQISSTNLRTQVILGLFWYYLIFTRRDLTVSRIV